METLPCVLARFIAWVGLLNAAGLLSGQEHLRLLARQKEHHLLQL